MSQEPFPDNAHIFPVRPLVAGLAVLGLAMIGLMIFIYLLVFLTGSDLTCRDLLIIPATLPLVFFLLYLLHRSAGAAVLTDNTVIFIRFKQRWQMRYEEVRAMKEKDLHLLPNLVLIGEGKKLRISRQLQDFPRFYQILSSRCPAVRSEKISFPFRIAIRPAFLFWNAVGLLVFFVLLSGLFVLMVWNADTTGAILLACVVPLFLWCVLLLLFVYSEVMPELPVRWEFGAGEIRMKKVFKPWEVYSIHELEFIRLEEQETNGYPHPVVVLKILGVDWVVNIRRARQFGYEPERLYLALSELYPGKCAAG